MNLTSAIISLFKYKPLRIYTTLSPMEVRHCIQHILRNENPLQRQLDGQVRLEWFELMLKEEVWQRSDSGNVSVKGELEEAEDGGTFVTVTEFSFLRSELASVMMILMMIIFVFIAYNTNSWELTIPALFVPVAVLVFRNHKSSNYHLLADIIKYALEEEEKQQLK